VEQRRERLSTTASSSVVSMFCSDATAQREILRNSVAEQPREAMKSEPDDAAARETVRGCRRAPKCRGAIAASVHRWAIQQLNSLSAAPCSLILTLPGHAASRFRDSLARSVVAALHVTTRACLRVR
jgi:hypothetical protein